MSVGCPGCGVQAQDANEGCRSCGATPIAFQLQDDNKRLRAALEQIVKCEWRTDLGAFTVEAEDANEPIEIAKQALSQAEVENE